MLDFASLPAGSASVLLWIAGAWLALTCLVAVPMLVLAQRAEKPLEAALRDAERAVEPMLDELAEIRAPSGAAFFASETSRRELAEQIADVRVIAGEFDPALHSKAGRRAAAGRMRRRFGPRPPRPDTGPTQVAITVDQSFEQLHRAVLAGGQGGVELFEVSGPDGTVTVSVKVPASALVWIWDPRNGKEWVNPHAPGQSRGRPGALSPPA